MSFGVPLITKALSAASKGDLNTLKSLKDQDVNLSDCSDKFGATPVHYAARAGKVDCLRWLIQTAGVSGNKPANNGATPAHDAAATGQLDCLQWLIQNGGCRASDTDSCGATPLHLAARFDHLAVVVWLVESEGCNAVDRAQNGVTPVHLAAAKGSINCLRWLTQHNKSSVNKRADNGTTPVYFAAQEGRLDCLQFLVTQVDGNCRLRASDGMAPVHAAAQMGQLQCTSWLIEHAGVSANERDNDGATPTHFAAARGHVHVLRWLLSHGAKVETDDLGGTPLHDAAEHGQLEVLKTLAMMAGVDPHIRDLDGLTPADLAEECGHNECAQFLRSYQPPEPATLELSDGVPQDLSSTGYIIHSTLSALHSLAQTTDSVKPLVSTKDSPSTMFTSNTADTRGSSLQQKPSPVPKSVVSRPEKSEVKAARSEPIPTQKEENELQVAFSRLKQKTAAEEVQNALKLAEPEPVEKALPERTKDYKVQDPLLMRRVREFAPTALKNVPEQKKNLKPTKLGRVATDEPKKHWSERKPPEGWAKITQSKKAAKAEMVDGGRTKAEAEEMEEEEEEEEDDEIPLWRRALMKKKAKEQKMKGQAEKQQGHKEKAKWENIPAWKRVVLEKRENERAKQQALVADKQRKEAEKQAEFEALPEWKKRLIMKQRSS